ncbi:MAG: DUF1836 domain-containing protein [Eubacterium sp.]|nr:DUF1836 domain-containing protein [Eubacterium sp.]
MPHLKNYAPDSFRPLIKAADGLTLSQVCSITGLEPSTVQNWVKRGFVARPVNKKYRVRHLSRIMLISLIRDSMKIESIGELMKMVNGSADDESDDIISEDKLLEYFCVIIDKVKVSPENGIEDTVRDCLGDYIPPSESAYSRLTDALCVMVNAYIASEYKKSAEVRFENMKSRAY